TRNRFDLVGVSGTSAGALCALMVWYGVAPIKNGRAGSPGAAIEQLNDFWDRFAATTAGEKVLNAIAYSGFRAREAEVPVVGINAPIFSLSPSGAISQAVIAGLPLFGVRRRFFDLDDLLAKACPQFDDIDWPKLQTRLLVGASEIVGGIETAFDSDLRMPGGGGKHTKAIDTNRWRRRLPLTLRGVAASGTLAEFRQAEEIDGRYYWDGLYSQNPPVREFLAGVRKNDVPDEIWIVRINPQQSAEQPQSNAEIIDRENQLMGNLSLNKELDFILTVNDGIAEFGGAFAKKYKHVTVRTIK